MDTTWKTYAWVVEGELKEMKAQSVVHKRDEGRRVVQALFLIREEEDEVISPKNHISLHNVAVDVEVSVGMYVCCIQEKLPVLSQMSLQERASVPMNMQCPTCRVQQTQMTTSTEEAVPTDC